MKVLNEKSPTYAGQDPKGQNRVSYDTRSNMYIKIIAYFF